MNPSGRGSEANPGSAGGGRRSAAEALPLTNAQVADRLEETADLLEDQGANPFRVRAYRNAATTLRRAKRPAHKILRREGLAGLVQLPAIGESLARAIEQLALTGRLGILERLRGEAGAEQVLATVPTIGPELAARIHKQLDVETLEDLEVAAYDGTLAQVPGMGRKRIQAVRESLAGRFRRRPRAPEAPSRRGDGGAQAPPVEELLDIDRQYRAKAANRRLPRIAPRRFNPTGEAWLPVLHTQRQDRHYTALYSNTARAHELGTIGDWVVVYRDDDGGHGQWTIVTSRFGRLRGKRIVRGREQECEDFYSRRGREEPAQSHLPGL